MLVGGARAAASGRARNSLVSGWTHTTPANTPQRPARCEKRSHNTTPTHHQRPTRKSQTKSATAESRTPAPSRNQWRPLSPSISYSGSTRFQPIAAHQSPQTNSGKSHRPKFFYAVNNTEISNVFLMPELCVP